MHIIILGCREVGQSIARHFAAEGHALVVVDEDPENLQNLAESLDVQTLCGVGSHPSILEAAGADQADMLIAVTPSDELNMVACQMAHALFQVPKKIARIRELSYLKLVGSHVYSATNLPVDVVISPELEVAAAIEKTLEVPGAFDAQSFAQERLMLVGVRLGQQAPILGEKLARWPHLGVRFEALVLFRDERLLLPDGEDHLEPGDDLYFLSRTEHLAESLNILGKHEHRVENAMIIGGGSVGYHLALRLQQRHTNLRILEKDRDRARFLADRLDRVTIVHGDALNQDILKQENAGRMDAVLCVTSDDAVNILAAVQAQQMGVDNTLALIQRPSFVPLAEQVGLNKVISPQQITVSRILQHVRRGQVESVHTVRDGMGEVLMIQVDEDCRANGCHIRDLPCGAARVAAVLRPDGRIVLPREENVPLQKGDHILIFARYEALHAVEKLFGLKE